MTLVSIDEMTPEQVEQLGRKLTNPNAPAPPPPRPIDTMSAEEIEAFERQHGIRMSIVERDARRRQMGR